MAPAWRRRALVALLLPVAAWGAGCASDPPAEEPVILPGLFTADAGGVQPVDRIPGLSMADGAWTWRPLDGMAPDSTRLLAFQVLQDALFEFREDADVQTEAGSPVSEAPGADGVCIQGGQWVRAPGDFFIGRATGSTPDMPGTVFEGSVGGARGTGAGGGGFAGSGQGNLSAGEWMLFFAGLAGYDPGFAMETSEWTVTFRIPSAVRIVELAPAPFHCGFGFSSLPGADAVPGPVPYASGGELTVETVCGSKFDFCPTFDLSSNAAPVTALLNQAEVEFLGNVSELSSAAPTQLASEDGGLIVLRNERWAGSPSWTLQGLAIPALDPLTFFC